MSAKAKLAGLVAPELKPYLKYSLAFHAALGIAAMGLLGAAGLAPKNTVYTIDFVGGSASVITSAGPQASAPSASASREPLKPPPQKDFDEFGRRRRKRFSLPKPSLLRGAKPPQEPAAAAARPSATSAAAASGAATSGSGAGADSGGISADMPNFPYPWYITQVRQMLWQQWLNRMPSQAGECVVVFSLMRSGAVTDLRTESTSGDSAFDLAAMAAVQDAGPYPALPSGFHEPFLKIHVTLRSQ